MANDRLVWLFGSSGEDAVNDRLVKFWRFCRANMPVTTYLVVRQSPQNEAFVRALDSSDKAHVVVSGSRRHLRVAQKSDLALVGMREQDVFPDASRPTMRPPLVVFPNRGDEPAVEICGDYTDNTLFRFVAQDESCARYLEIAKDLRPYQIVLDGNLYAEGALWEQAAGRLADTLLFAQTHRFVFLGFALTHIGGTPMATHALAEGLLEKGYQVSYMTLRKTVKASTPPAIPIVSVEGLVQRLSRLRKFGYSLLPKRLQALELRFDPGAFNPLCGRLLRGVLRRMRCTCAISTRDSLHPFLARDVRLPIGRKVFFFHCPSLWWKPFFGRATEIIKRLRIKKSVFVTEANRRALTEDCGLTNCEEELVLGNGLSSERMILREQIAAPSVSDTIRACWPVRIEESRRSELEDCLSFGEFLRTHGVKHIKIDVYGNGAFAKHFAESIVSRGLQDFIAYRGSSADMKATYAKYDAVVDFTKAQSFGMVYIEAVLNGKMIFCYRNEGSSEVLKGVRSAYFEDYSDLLDKLLGLREMSLSQLQENYDMIASRFSRTAIATRFLDFLNRD